MRPAVADSWRPAGGYLPLGLGLEREWTTEYSENTERGEATPLNPNRNRNPNLPFRWVKEDYDYD
jgi:hypothetical protein